MTNDVKIGIIESILYLHYDIDQSKSLSMVLGIGVVHRLRIEI